MKEYDIYHVGISGGKDSTALLLWAVHESGFPVDKIRATFCDTGNEHQITYDYIQMLSEVVHPIETIKPPLDFYKLAKKKGMFPSVKARFCTQQLKIFPSQKRILEWQNQGLSVLLMSGVRRQESKKRSQLEQFEFDTYYMADMYRPLLEWSIDDVWSMLKKYNVQRNQLYDFGAVRVGCLPCIMSSKLEIRMIAKNFPERIDMIRKAERETGKNSSFFHVGFVPARFCSKNVETKDGRSIVVPTIDDVVEWSKTGMRRPDQYEFDFEFSACNSNLGMCE